LADGRHAELVFHTTNIAAYFLSYSLDPRNISEKWLRGYEDAVAWLQAVAAGKVTVNFPVRELREGINNDLTVRGGDIALSNNYNY
jgi:phage gp36-like protein